MCMSALKAVGSQTMGMIGGIPGLVGAMSKKRDKANGQSSAQPGGSVTGGTIGPSPSFNPYGG